MANITTTVNDSTTSVGTNSSSYHSSLLVRVPTNRDAEKDDGRPEHSGRRHVERLDAGDERLRRRLRQEDGVGPPLRRRTTAEGRRPYRERRVSVRQFGLRSEGLEARLERRGTAIDDGLQLILHLAEIDAYERVNDTCEQYFDEAYPARTAVGVHELLGGAAVTVDAVVAVE